MKEEQFQKELLRRLDVLISIQLDATPSEGQASIVSKVCRLVNLGLAPAEVATIIGKPVNYITAILATKRARTKKANTNG